DLLPIDHKREPDPIAPLIVERDEKGVGGNDPARFVVDRRAEGVQVKFRVQDTPKVVEELKMIGASAGRFTFAGADDREPRECTDPFEEGDLFPVERPDSPVLASVEHPL